MTALEKIQTRIKNSRIWVHPKSGNQRLYLHGFSRKSQNMNANAYLTIVNDRITPCMDVYCKDQGEAWEDNYKRPIIDRMYEQFHELINNCELERRKTPLHERLRDDIVPVYEDSMIHQAQALRFCCTMKVSALFADTGTGKSKIAIDLAVSRFEAGQINKVLLFCPVSTKKNFKDEINKWCQNSELKWEIVGLETMSASDQTYLELLPRINNETFIIIDESHKIKTPFAKRSRRIKACCDKVSYKLIMTGTPSEGVKDLFMQYAMLSDLIIGEPNWMKFEQKYLIVDNRGDIIGYKNVDYLMGLIEPYTYQIDIGDCINLPAKYFKEIKCQMNKEQTELYNHLKHELLDNIDNYFSQKIEVPATLIFLYYLRLQQISCGFHKDEDGNTRLIGCGKFKNLIATGYESGQTLFFCKFLTELHQLIEFLGPENCAVFTGENRKERDAEKDLFTSGQKKYFVATMGAGGTGLNGLQHCNRIVFLSNSFKWIEKKQCIGRIDRKGQENKMEIYDMISDCGIDRRIVQNLRRKGNLADEIKEMLKDKTKLKQYIEEL